MPTSQPHRYIAHYKLQVPIICEDGTPAMNQKNIALRDSALNGALRNLLGFLLHRAAAEPNREHWPYDNITLADLPILPRTKPRVNAGDPTFIYNTEYCIFGHWTGIKARMFDPNHKQYAIYGGKPRVGPAVDLHFTGQYPFRYNVVALLQFAIMIEVCLGRPPSADYTIDKVSNSRGYLATNLRWSDKKEQSRNRGQHKYYYTEPAVPRIPHMAARLDAAAIRRMHGDKPKGKTGSDNKRSYRIKTMNTKIKRMANMLFKKHNMRGGSKGKRTAREAATANRILHHLRRPNQTPQYSMPSRTLSMYSTDTDISHTITPHCTLRPLQKF